MASCFFIRKGAGTSEAIWQQRYETVGGGDKAELWLLEDFKLNPQIKRVSYKYLASIQQKTEVISRAEDPPLIRISLKKYVQLTYLELWNVRKLSRVAILVRKIKVNESIRCTIKTDTYIFSYDV